MTNKNSTREAAELFCRVVLVTPPLQDGLQLKSLVEKALAGGDVASVIIDGDGLDETTFQKNAEMIVPVIQQAGAAALIVNDTRIAGRVGADGLHIEGKAADLADAIERFSPKMIVGFGNVRDRHSALEIGELQPDYLFFGKIGADNKEEAHPRNISLAEWWAQMIEIPCIVQAGNNLENTMQTAQTGADFVAFGRAVFDAEDPQAAVAEANRLLEEHAPVFGD